ncbi:Mitochondrial folate transporter/carrier [Smittium mucronatum]|uniref:Mitochondrial folate transporter/carrier n=1 Tax=Smittium mucronatum TaxID=133383 RepID=A0A1R0GPQ1_9FUNG|nr:Mitochondrial folate transporter/carrier [Smittium mucronatum]
MATFSHKRQADNAGTSFLSPGQHLVAGSLAGVMTQVVANPVWVLKVRMCTDVPTTSPTSALPSPSTPKYTGVLSGLLKISREEGFRGLYKGFAAGVIGVSHGALQFMAYEEMKKYLVALRSRSFSPDDLAFLKQQEPNLVYYFSTAEFLAMSASSKLFASVVTYPYQVVRTRMMQDQGAGIAYNKLGTTFTHIYRTEGLQGFYKGLGPNIVRVLPGTMITFLVYENVSKYFRDHSSPC